MEEGYLMKLTKNGWILFCSALAIIAFGAVWIVSMFRRTGTVAISGVMDFLMVILMCAATFLLMAAWRVE